MNCEHSQLSPSSGSLTALTARMGGGDFFAHMQYGEAWKLRRSLFHKREWRPSNTRIPQILIEPQNYTLPRRHGINRSRSALSESTSTSSSMTQKTSCNTIASEFIRNDKPSCSGTFKLLVSSGPPPPQLHTVSRFCRKMILISSTPRRRPTD